MERTTAPRDYSPSRHTTSERDQQAAASIRRELAAIRTTALPAYSLAVDREDRNTSSASREVMRRAQVVQHRLLLAGVRASALAAASADIAFEALCDEVQTLVTRAADLGVYRGAEGLMPQVTRRTGRAA
jgi:hypothetical protein